MRALLALLLFPLSLVASARTWRPETFSVQESFSYSDVKEWNPWHSDSLLKREWVLYRASPHDLQQSRMQMGLVQLILYRVPIEPGLNLYGENFTQLPTYGEYPNAHETRLFETKSSVGLEWVARPGLRFRLPVFFEQKFFRMRETNGFRGEWRHGMWIAPQVAWAAFAKSELLFTTSTLSFVNADFTSFSVGDGVTPCFFQVLLRMTL